MELRDGQDVRHAERRVFRFKLWRARGRRLAIGANAALALLLAVCALVFVNVLSLRWHKRWDLSSTRATSLSQRTLKLLGSLSGTLRVVSFFEAGNEMGPDIRLMLEAYADAAGSVPGLRLDLEFVDPDRDLARTRELVRVFGLSEPNLVLFEYEGRRRIVEERRIVEWEQTVDYRKLLSGQPSVTRRRTSFNAEQAFSSAILSLSKNTSPTVYFTTGHGERKADDFGETRGYSGIARFIKRDSIGIMELILAGKSAVPPDASAVVIAGPVTPFTSAETALIEEYLGRGGRVFLIVSPYVETGLEGLAARWGVRPGTDSVGGATLSGSEMVINTYGDHPITRPMRDVMTVFYGPRNLEVLDPAAAGAADRPTVTVLAWGEWVETDRGQHPPRYDAEADRLGPAPVAVAVERGKSEDLHLGIRPSRMVVLGDADFVSNGALRAGAAGNRDLFMNSLNWLVDRDEVVAVAARAPTELRPEMGRSQWLRAYVVVTLIAPACLLAVALAVWARRR